MGIQPAGGCRCPCHTTPNFRHFMSCCPGSPASAAGRADEVRRRTVIEGPQMTEERYTAIFLEEGVDREWAQICYRREVKAGVVLTEAYVRLAAQDWASDDQDDSF